MLKRPMGLCFWPIKATFWPMKTKTPRRIAPERLDGFRQNFAHNKSIHRSIGGVNFVEKKTHSFEIFAENRKNALSMAL
jgi:hypothetical protein